MNSGPDRVMIDKAVEYAKDLVETVKEKHAEARQMYEESERLRLQGGQGGGYGGQQQQQGGGPQYSQPIHYPGVGQPGGENQSPYNYQVRKSSPFLFSISSRGVLIYFEFGCMFTYLG